MGRTARKMPAGWENYSSIGSVIEDTRIFAFKTPLYGQLQKHISKNRHFTTMDLFRKLTEKGQTLGLIINCSNTRRYYDRNDIEGMLVGYKELLCPGRGFLVRTDLIKDFTKEIDEFLSHNQHNELLIGVHCGDGINRSGYLICHYLICSLGWSSHQALNAFESARGYPIQRGSYIQTLHKADSERRLKANIIPLYGIDQSLETKNRKKRKIERELSGTEGIDDSNMSGKMMHQFFKIEQQFKQVASNALIPNISFSMSCSNQLANETTTTDIGNNSMTSKKDNTIDDYASDNDDDLDEEDSSSNIDFESMGRIDTKEPTSKSQLRRQRRQKREKMFHVMKKGRFWEINDMRNQMQK